jgi:hypothetical protein
MLREPCDLSLRAMPMAEVSACLTSENAVSLRSLTSLPIHGMGKMESGLQIKVIVNPASKKQVI